MDCADAESAIRAPRTRAGAIRFIIGPPSGKLKCDLDKPGAVDGDAIFFAGAETNLLGGSAGGLVESGAQAVDDAEHLDLAGGVKNHFERYGAFEFLRARFARICGLRFPENFDRGFGGLRFSVARGAGRRGFFGAVAEAGVGDDLPAASAMARSAARTGIAEAAEMNGHRGCAFGRETTAAARRIKSTGLHFEMRRGRVANRGLSGIVEAASFR